MKLDLALSCLVLGVAAASAAGNASETARAENDSRAASAGMDESYGKWIGSGPKDRRAVALTFDDGPSASTPLVLDLLKRHKAKATFFMLGGQAEKFPELAKRVQREGHLVANHSFSHPNFWVYKKDDKEQKLAGEIRSAREAIRRATGVDQAFFRMPHGFGSPWVKETARREKVVLVGWGYGSDWTKISREQMLKEYLASLRPGAILLFHDGEGDRSKTLWVAERVLAELKKKDLEPVRIDELLKSQLE